MATTTPKTSQKGTLIILAATLLFIIIVVIIGLCVRFTTEGKTQQIILIILICLLGTIGMTGVIILEIRRRRTINENKRLANRRVNYRIAPTAPPLTNPSSWNFSKNYSNRTTVQA